MPGAIVETEPIQQGQILILEGYPDRTQQSLLGPNGGTRRWGVAEERSEVQAWTAIKAREQGIVPVPPPVHVTYCYVVPDHTRRDWDNYALIAKPVQDGLVKAGILVGDHYAVLTGDVRFRVQRGCSRLEVVIEQEV